MPPMCDASRRVKAIVETANTLLRKAEKRRRAIIDEIRAVNEYINGLDEKSASAGRE